MNSYNKNSNLNAPPSIKLTQETECAWCRNVVWCEDGCMVLCQVCSKTVFNPVAKDFYVNVPGPVAYERCWCGGKDGKHIYGVGGHGPELGE